MSPSPIELGRTVLKIVEANKDCDGYYYGLMAGLFYSYVGQDLKRDEMYNAMVKSDKDEIIRLFKYALSMYS